MVQRVTTLNFQPVDQGKRSWAAFVNVDSAIDSEWLIDVRGNFSDIPSNITVQYLMVDNVGNDDIVFVLYGPFRIAVPEFTRSTMSFPWGTQSVRVEANTGEVGVWFSTDLVAPDTTNLKAINAALAGDVLIPIIERTVSGNMSSSMLGSQIVFNSSTAINFSLLSAASLANGFFVYIVNSNDGVVSVIPSGSEEINGVWTNASPLLLPPKSEGRLIGDGVGWIFSGKLQRDVVAHTPLSGAAGARGSVSFSSIFNTSPTIVRGALRNISATLGYALGDVLYLDMGANASGLNGDVWYSYVLGSTVVKWDMITQRGRIMSQAGGGGTSANISDNTFEFILHCEWHG